MTSETVTEAGAGPPNFGAAHVPRSNWGWFLVRGLLALAVGVVAIVFPGGALLAFTTLFAAFAFADGVVCLMTGFLGARHRDERWWTLILRGLLGILVGVVFAAMPVLSTVAYALLTLAMISVWSILAGVLEIAAAIRLRREIVGEWLLGLSGVLSILLGIAIPVVIMTNPVATVVSVAWLIGIYAFAAGFTLIAQAVRLRARPAR